MAHPPVPKRRRISPPEPETAISRSSKATNGLSKADSELAKISSDWDLEQAYERRARKRDSKKDSNKLPIKTQEGWVQSKLADEPPQSEDEEEAIEQQPEADDEGSEVQEGVEDDSHIDVRQLIFEAKEELAKLAEQINEDPEENIAVLKKLAHINTSSNTMVKKLALATRMTVYKDIAPGYRIKPLSEEQVKEKVSKDIRRLRDFEQTLVRSYQQYVKELSQYSRGSKTTATKDQAGLATVAISCACSLLTHMPHFNYRTELLEILVGKVMTRQVDADFVKCRETLETLFKEDEDGYVAYDAVQMLTKRMKEKEYKMDESVLNMFLHLRLLSEFTFKASTEKVEKGKKQTNGEEKPKMKKKDRVHISKRNRKLLKARKEVEADMKEADATVTHEERDKMQGETLKLVFVAYFRILKARIPNLMGAVLEGLAKYAHLINQDFFGDILEALKDLIAYSEAKAQIKEEGDNEPDEEDTEVATAPRNATRESLLCVITAFALLSEQDTVKSAASLHLDLNFFILHLYRTLFSAALNPDLEFSAKTLRLSDPHLPAESQGQPPSRINVQTTIVLLIRSLSSTLLPPHHTRSVPPLRLAAFAKKLLTACLHLPEKSCVAMIGLLAQVARVQGKKIAALWYTEERKGDGVYQPLREDVEGCNPFAATAWEGEMLRLHWSEKVRDAYRVLEREVRDSRS